MLRERELGIKSKHAIATAAMLREQAAAPQRTAPPSAPQSHTERHNKRARMSASFDLDTVTSRATTLGHPADTVTSFAATLHGNGVEQDEVNYNTQIH